MTYRELATAAIETIDSYSGDEAERMCAIAEAYIAQGAVMARVRAVLADFYLSPLSMSSVGPVMDLAEELNPILKPVCPQCHGDGHYSATASNADGYTEVQCECQQ